MTRELLEGELSWADKAIANILADAEKYQDVLRDLSDDAIRSTINKLDTTSSEFLAGLNVLTYKAEAETEDALKTGREEIDELVSDAVTRTSTTYKEVDDELWDRIFGIERELDGVLNEADKEATVQEEYRDYLEQDALSIIEGFTTTLADDLHNTLWGWMPDLGEASASFLFSIAGSAVFDKFMGSFFEESE